MDKLTTMLLTGAALGALSVAPAVATPHHPMFAVRTADGAIVVRGNVHSKADIHTPGTTKFTTTGTFPFTGNESTMYKNTVDLPGGTWFTVTSGGHCASVPGQKIHATKDPHARIKVYTSKKHLSLSICTGTLTLYGPAYRLNDKNATTDSFRFSDEEKYTTTSSGGKKHKYDKTFVNVWDITID